MKKITLNNIEKSIMAIIVFYFFVSIIIFFKYPNIFKTTIIFLGILVVGNISFLINEKISISKNHTFYGNIIKRNQMIRLWTTIILGAMAVVYFLSELGIITKDKIVLLNVCNGFTFLLIAITGNYSLNVKPNNLIGINSGTIKTSEIDHEFRKANNFNGKFQFYSGIIGIILTILLPQHLEIFNIPIGLHLMFLFVILYPASLFISSYFGKEKIQ